MELVRHSVRASIAKVETSYELQDDALLLAAGAEVERLPFAEIARVRLFQAPSMRYRGMGDASYGGCELLVIETRDRRKFAITSKHFVKLGVFEDRAATFGPFGAALLRRVREGNPQAELVRGFSAGLWWFYLGALLLLVICMLFGVLMVFSAATGGGTWIGLIFGAIFTLFTAL
ncbi:MAG: hypothetical protein JNM84_23455, partial [Planctomycetes bacterium]|nr:hypothetical protein [Planctomycetota bacterium]